jgi:hypothetical protein
MANAPSHGTDAATKIVTVYDKNGDAHEVTRLNALDLTRTGDYFWKAEDINKPHPEEEGPADPKAKMQTVYDAAGNKIELDNANARDMVNTGNYFWNDPTDTTQVEALDKVIDAASALAAAEAAVVDEPADEESPTDVNPADESLSAQAERVTGESDVEAYLKGFSAERLRDMANERYGENIHHRSSLDTIIKRIVELEDVKTVGDDQAKA